MRLIVFCTFLLCITGSALWAQQVRIVNQDDCYFKLNEGVSLVVNDSSDSVFVAAGSGPGYLESEGENNVVKWMIGNASGHYVVPFNSAWGVSDQYIPVNMEITSPGSADGFVVFSTYETATDSNMAYPTGVTNMNGGNGSDISLFTVDRFWRIDASAYTAKPDVTLALTYVDAVSEIGGANTITETLLAAQRFNTVLGSWESKSFGVADAPNRTVNSIIVPAADFFQSWTLAQEGEILSVDLRITDYACHEGVLTIAFYREKEGRVTLERLNQHNEWKEVQTETSTRGENTITVDNAGDSFYRLRADDGYEATYSNALRASCFPNDPTVNIFPNPTNGSLLVQTPYAFSTLHIVGSKGELIRQMSLEKGQHVLDLTGWNNQLYYFVITDAETGESQILKVAKTD